jgi:hypothetical protein
MGLDGSYAFVMIYFRGPRESREWAYVVSTPLIRSDAETLCSCLLGWPFY